MANVLVAMTIGGRSYYGIFHIHFSSKGDLISRAPSPGSWKPLVDSSWESEWCELLTSQSRYAEDAKEQGCLK